MGFQELGDGHGVRILLPDSQCNRLHPPQDWPGGKGVEGSPEVSPHHIDTVRPTTAPQSHTSYQVAVPVQVIRSAVKYDVRLEF